MDERLNRRRFLGAAGKTAGVVGLGALLAGCSESATLSPGPRSPSAAIATGVQTGTSGQVTTVCPTDPGTVTFSESEIIASNASALDQSALTRAVTNSWTRYLARDVPGTVGAMTHDITRMSGNWGVPKIEQGSDTVANHLPGEWDASELAGGDPSGGVAEQYTIKRADIFVDAAGSFATVSYWISVVGGFRWCESSTGWVLQEFAKQDGAWKICHQIDGGASDVDPDTMSGSELFRFDWYSPATNLERAVDFYTPILGTPESVTKDQATWVFFRGSRFVVDATRLGGVVKIRPNWCNGWGTIYVDDVAAERDRLIGEGVTFISGTDTSLLANAAGDRYAIGLDNPVGGSENIFVIMQRDMATSGPAPASPSGFDPSDPYQAASHALATAWVSQDASTIRSMFGPSGRFYDDTRNRALGLVTGGNNVATVLSSTLWPRYDRSPDGLSADLVASSVRTRSIGSRTVVSYLMTLTGTGIHPFKERVFATDVFDADMNVVFMVRIASDVQQSGMVLALDYSDVPTRDLPAAREFYEKTMGFGKAYKDNSYRGWWADNQVVWGTAAATRAVRPGNANGYMSFWVPSARDAARELRRSGASLPVVNWINSWKAHNRPSGVSVWPGYTEVVFTDSEGTVNVCTEYTGM